MINKKALRRLLLWEKRPRATAAGILHNMVVLASLSEMPRPHGCIQDMYNIFLIASLICPLSPPFKLWLWEYMYSSNALGQQTRALAWFSSNDDVTLHMGYILSHNLMQRFAVPITGTCASPLLPPYSKAICPCPIIWPNGCVIGEVITYLVISFSWL